MQCKIFNIRATISQTCLELYCNLILLQIIGGAVLHDGSIAEMKTGEGKTLVSTLAAYLNALSGEGVHGMIFFCFLTDKKMMLI